MVVDVGWDGVVVVVGGVVVRESWSGLGVQHLQTARNEGRPSQTGWREGGRFVDGEEEVEAGGGLVCTRTEVITSDQSSVERGWQCGLCALCDRETRRKESRRSGEERGREKRSKLGLECRDVRRLGNSHIEGSERRMMGSGGGAAVMGWVGGGDVCRSLVSQPQQRASPCVWCLCAGWFFWSCALLTFGQEPKFSMSAILLRRGLLSTLCFSLQAFPEQGACPVHSKCSQPATHSGV